MAPSDSPDELPYGKRLLPQIIEASARTNPHRVMGMIAKSPDVSNGFRKVTVGELARAIDFTAYWIEEQIGGSKSFETIAYLGLQDFRYHVMHFAAIKCGYTLLLPSARNSSSDNASLFCSVHCKKFFHSGPYEMKALALQQEGVVAYPVPGFDDMLLGNGRPYPYEKTWAEAKFDPILICHTSGSTGAPKPVVYNHAFMGAWDAVRKIPGAYGRPDANQSLMTGATYYLGFPLFHLMGVTYGPYTLFYDTVLVLPSPDVPANARSIIDIMANIDVEHLMAPPTVYDDLIKNHQQEFSDHCRALKIVYNAGGPLSSVTGDFLASKFDILQIIGSTETSKICTLLAERRYWQWFEWNPNVKGLRMEKVDADSELYELVLERIPGNEWVAGQGSVFYTQPHLDIYRSRDLFNKHPIKQLWRFEGRRDDVIVLNNGEKFNPVAVESFIQNHPLVTGVMVVGNSKEQVGLILEGKDPLDDLVEKVWPTIEKANEQTPRHARIYKHMVMTTPPAKPFLRASKGTIQRFASTEALSEEIDALFSRNKKSARAQKGFPKLKLPKDTIKDFVRQGVAYQLQREDFADNQDLYFLGMDSLQTTELARTIADGLWNYSPSDPSQAISARLVYDNPSVAKITDAVFALLNPELIRDEKKPYDVDRLALDRMKELFKKYTAELPQRAVKRDNRKQISTKQQLKVAVTGTTGFFGYYLLSILLDDPAISQITCLNRSPAAAGKFLEQRSTYDMTSTLPDSKLKFVEASFGEPALGLPPETYRWLLDEIDVIIHNAWQVDFNRNLSSFENPHLIGVDNIIRWSMRSARKVHVYFVSTVATTGASWPSYFGSQAAEDGTPSSPGVTHKASAEGAELPSTWDFSRIPSGGFGYAQSKYVAEAMLAHAAASQNVPVTILRPGQISNPVDMSGPPVHRHEWFPSLLRSSRAMGLLPEAVTPGGGELDFIPVDRLAKITRDIILHATTNMPDETSSSSNRDGAAAPTNPQIFNLVNPRTVPFTSVISTILDSFARRATKSGSNNSVISNVNPTKIIPFRAWVNELEKLDQDHGSRSADDPPASAQSKYPALKILGFFQSAMLPDRVHDDGGVGSEGKYGAIGVGGSKSAVDTTRACQVSRTMRELEPITPGDVEEWLVRWEM